LLQVFVSLGNNLLYSLNLKAQEDPTPTFLRNHEMATVDNNVAKAGQVAAATPVALKAVTGSLGGVIEAILLQPMNTVTHRLQLDSRGEYRGVGHCFRQIAAEEGTAALWKGTNAFMSHLVLKYALRMGTNGIFTNLLRDEDGELTAARRMAAGFAAGVVEATLIVTPFGVVEIAMQTQRGHMGQLKDTSSIQTALNLARTQGPMSLMKGWTPTVCRNGTNQMFMFSTKAYVDTLLWGKKEGDKTCLTSTQSMTSGFIAGCVGPLVTAPFDVARSRMMAQDANNPIYRNMLHCWYKTGTEEGARALFKGLIPRLMRVPPGQAIVWAVSDRLIYLYQQSQSNGSTEASQPTPQPIGTAHTAAGSATRVPMSPVESRS